MNFLLRTDSYKITHWKQYPPETTGIYSYFESRGGMFRDTIFFGLQYYLRAYLEGSRFTLGDVENADIFCNTHFGQALFNRDGWTRLYYRHHGRMPIRIKAVPEGTAVPTGNVLVTVENTDPEFPWLTNYLETLLVKVWYPITVATLSRGIKSIILGFLQSNRRRFLRADASITEVVQLERKERWVSRSCCQSLELQTWGKANEVDAYRNMLMAYPRDVVACVSDSYDIYNACEKIWGEILKPDVVGRRGTLVIRPDSGDPVQVLVRVFDILSSKFGFTTNAKGYRVLPTCVRVIQGDGVNLFTIQNILFQLAKFHGWSADNINFGMGGALLQQLNRDTQRFAFKCSAAKIKGEWRPVFKDPVTDPGKNSKHGRLVLVQSENEQFTTLENVPDEDVLEDHLRVVFENGDVVADYDLDSIRQRARLTPDEVIA